MSWLQKCILACVFFLGVVICRYIQADEIPAEHEDAWSVINEMRAEKDLPPLTYSSVISADCTKTAELQKTCFGGGLCHLAGYENLAANRGDHEIEDWSVYTMVTKTYINKFGCRYTKRVRVPVEGAYKITKLITGVFHAVDKQWRHSSGHYANIVRQNAAVGGLGFYKDNNGHTWVCFRTAASMNEYRPGQERQY